VQVVAAVVFMPRELQVVGVVGAEEMLVLGVRL
jgi:hypothetical protein